MQPNFLTFILLSFLAAIENIETRWVPESNSSQLHQQQNYMVPYSTAQPQTYDTNLSFGPTDYKYWTTTPPSQSWAHGAPYHRDSNPAHSYNHGPSYNSTRPHYPGPAFTPSQAQGIPYHRDLNPMNGYNHGPSYNSTRPHYPGPAFTPSQAQGTPFYRNSNPRHGYNHGPSYNSTRPYNLAHGFAQGGNQAGQQWAPIFRPNNEVQNNSSRLYPSLAYFREAFGTEQNGVGRPFNP